MEDESSSSSKDNMAKDDKSNPATRLRTYTPSELAVFDLLQHPVWVFDIENVRMFWANGAALEIWNAASLEELRERDFKTGLSDTMKHRMQYNLSRLKLGHIQHEQWTAYPKGQSITLALSGSPIRIDGGRIAVLCETELPSNTNFQNASVRGVEMLRYLPIVVSQFDIDGKTLTYQNSESLSLFGGSDKEEEEKTKSSSSSPAEEEKKDETASSFLERFVDRKLGRYVLEQVQQGKDCSIEAEQYTTPHTPRSFTVSVRRIPDPVTSKPMILYSARDISEMIQARQDTKQACNQADFVATISHELRTPLHQIIGYMDLLELTHLSPSQLEAVKMAQVSSVSLMSIISDLLDYSKLKNGKLQLETTLFDPCVVVNACLATIENEAHEKSLVLNNTHSADLPDRLLGDPNRLRQILLNLLSNAVKFTERGTISLKTTVMTPSDNDSENSTKKRLRFEVQDTGIGIHPQYHERIFEKYEHANATIASNYGGTGLGLTICKSLVERMGGEITLTSELGTGTTVVFELPFDLPPTNETLNKIQNDTVRPKQLSCRMMNAPSSNGDVKSLRILVVEDNVINQKMVRRMLQRMGHIVTVADHGKAAIDEINTSSEMFDLVLMDVQMPILDGIDATQRIRGMPGLDKASLPIVGLTATFEHSSLKFYQDIGMNHCIGKPATMKNLKRVIETYAKVARWGRLQQTILEWVDTVNLGFEYVPIA